MVFLVSRTGAKEDALALASRASCACHSAGAQCARAAKAMLPPNNKRIFLGRVKETNTKDESNEITV